jgi:hypothetical protein
MATQKSTPAPAGQSPEKAPDLARIAALAQEITITASCTADAAQGGNWDTNEEHVLICIIQRLGAAADIIRKELADGQLVGDANAWMFGGAA